MDNERGCMCTTYGNLEDEVGNPYKEYIKKDNNMVKKYIKKPIPVEAVQYTGDNEDELKLFCRDIRFTDILHEATYSHGDIYGDFVKTLEGNHEFNKGDYIIKGIKGEFYPCRQDIFEETYVHESEYHDEIFRSIWSCVDITMKRIDDIERYLKGIMKYIGSKWVV